LVLRTRERPDRAAARRAAKTLEAVPAITVITLRAPQARPKRDEGEPIEWSHRWLVRGHWAKRWHPAEQAHRLHYIAEYVKGPPEKPLIVTDRVFNIVR
jgi:hypothetical protein